MFISLSPQVGYGNPVNKSLRMLILIGDSCRSSFILVYMAKMGCNSDPTPTLLKLAMTILSITVSDCWLLTHPVRYS